MSPLKIQMLRRPSMTVEEITDKEKNTVAAKRAMKIYELLGRIERLLSQAKCSKLDHVCEAMLGDEQSVTVRLMFTVCHAQVVTVFVSLSIGEKESLLRLGLQMPCPAHRAGHDLYELCLTQTWSDQRLNPLAFSPLVERAAHLLLALHPADPA